MAHRTGGWTVMGGCLIIFDDISCGKIENHDKYSIMLFEHIWSGAASHKFDLSEDAADSSSFK